MAVSVAACRPVDRRKSLSYKFNERRNRRPVLRSGIRIRQKAAFLRLEGNRSDRSLDVLLSNSRYGRRSGKLQTPRIGDIGQSLGQ